MINLKKGFFTCVVIYNVAAFSQTGNLTSSPYSLFGVGRQNELGSGKTNALGRGGFALGSESEINSLNPASFGSIPKNSFFFDLGMKNENSYYIGSNDEQSNNTSNFSNISMALAFDKKSAIGVSLFPYTNVGYNISAVTGTVEGSSDFYRSNIVGSGGLNSFHINYGRKLNDRLNVGVRGIYYFGKINEVETVNIQENKLLIDESHYYKGIQFSLGGQYKLRDNLGIGVAVNLPASLSGSKEQAVSSVIDGVESEIEAAENIKIRSYQLPTEIGIGTKYTYKAFTFNADYKLSLWSGTNEEENAIDELTNQHFVGGGVEYLEGGRSYFSKMRFRMGGNYDTGHMLIDGSKIRSASVTAGIGLPLSLRYNSFINISYSYGQRGQLSDMLIRENYHLVSINLSLEEIWLVKRLIE
ncbi:hypothetical protein [Flavobacterium sp.]|uniref:hypothetical protein n=1 Tax=Flavobacterium sp. TaxID=239 RepID=UPI00260F54F4|nr:hypothetical protein [Flavobacterium sp.]